MDFFILNCLTLCGLLYLARCGLAYETGAPETICINHVPHHDHLAQQFTPSPYAIEVTPDRYSPGDILTVRLYGLQGESFRGYQVRAQQVGGDIEKFIGVFIEVPDDTQLQAWYPEDLEGRNCFTHKNNRQRTSIEVKWRAPNVSVGDIVFRGTMVQDFEHFWANITSNVLISREPKQVHYDSNTVLTTVANQDFMDDCGKSKGCLLYPNGCTSDCTHALAYEADPVQQMLLFEVYVKRSPAYVAVGFSEDLLMGNDSTVSCVAVDDYMEVHYGYSPATYNERHKIKPSLLKDMAVERKGDAIYCSFMHSYKDNVLKYDATTHQPYYVHFDYTAHALYLQLAWGAAYPRTPIPWKHDELPLISPSKVDLSKHIITYATQIPDHYKVHGSLGVTGWLLLGTLGMLISRHFKPDMTKQAGCGFLSRPVWFHLHFLAMVLCMILAPIGVIVMFVHLKDWTKYADTHAVFGLIAVALGLLNMVAGLLRPDPTHKRRPVFLWSHRIIAVLAFIAAWVTVLLGARIETLGSSLQSDLTTIVVVWLVFVVLLEVAFEVLTCWISRKDTYIINEKGDSGDTHPVKWILLVAAVLISIALFIAFVITLANA